MYVDAESARSGSIFEAAYCKIFVIMIFKSNSSRRKNPKVIILLNEKVNPKQVKDLRTAYFAATIGGEIQFFENIYFLRYPFKMTILKNIIQIYRFFENYQNT